MTHKHTGTCLLVVLNAQEKQKFGSLKNVQELDLCILPHRILDWHFLANQVQY